MKTIKLLPLLLLFIVASCSSVSVNSDYDKNVDFSAYKTYAYHKAGIDKVEISDLDKRRIVVYSKEIQYYNIDSFEKQIENEDDLIFPFSCKDIDGEPFTISFITRKKQDYRKQLYINQKEVILVYNIVNFQNK